MVDHVVALEEAVHRASWQNSVVSLGLTIIDDTVLSRIADVLVWQLESRRKDVTYIVQTRGLQFDH